MKLLVVKDQQLATIIAALRLWEGVLEGCQPDAKDVLAIAACSGRFEPLDASEIDALCERLHCRRRRKR